MTDTTSGQAATDEHWWFDWACPRCGHKPANPPLAVAEPIEGGGGLSLKDEDARCFKCGYQLQAGDHVDLCHDIGSETVERRTYKLP